MPGFLGGVSGDEDLLRARTSSTEWQRMSRSTGRVARISWTSPSTSVTHTSKPAARRISSRVCKQDAIMPVDENLMRHSPVLWNGFSRIENSTKVMQARQQIRLATVPNVECFSPIHYGRGV